MGIRKLDVLNLKRNKLLLVVCTLMMLLGCSCQLNKYTLCVFYSSTCATCKDLENNFLPLVSSEVEIVLYDIDDINNQELYKSYLQNLDNIDLSLLENPITPFIYMENGFGAIGYDQVMNDIYLELIEKTIQNEPYTIIPSGVWISKNKGGQ